MLDADHLTRSILQMAEQAAKSSLEDVAERARKHAPVRNLFKKERRRKVKTLTADVLAGAKSIGFERASRLSDRNGLQIERPSNIRNVAKTAYEVGTVRVRGRTNSYAPVVKTQFGRVAGVQLRTIFGPGTMKASEIHTSQGVVKVADLMSSRGRYEAFGPVGKDGQRKGIGRSAHIDAETGEITAGGTLRDSIKVEGPYVRGNKITGYVSAKALNEQGSFNYARAQEFGTAHNRPHPFLRPALRELARSIRTSQKNAFESAFRKPGFVASKKGAPVVKVSTVVTIRGFDRLARTATAELAGKRLTEEF